MRLTKAQKRNLDLKKRYQLFRSLGFNSTDSRKYSQLKSIKVDELKLTKRGTKTKLVNSKKLKTLQIKLEIDNYQDYYKKTGYENVSTVYSKWGYATHNQPDDDEYTMRTAKKIAKHYKETLDWGYYYLYLVSQSGYDYERMNEQINRDIAWEKYRKRK